MAGEVRITPAVKRVLELFLDDLSQPQWGYNIMATTGYPSGKVYQILERLEEAGWLTRHDAGHKARETGQRRTTYTMTAEAVPMIRRALTEADQRERRGSRIRVHLPRLQPDFTTGNRRGVLRWLTG
ncbi:helix-turn-helix transcriptional regulator [Nocardia sp. 348MFTsu5.1]|uniref:helix-turn-helix transcriptional regulator n=1 Tax=Nocardia sp. 348MFTsu5.1 TaxID=1172185 RepID=UPI0018CBBF11|nr:helix-turn-helix transcriptional regulator [Nocardia sp. 348MFTsu5.1]